MQANIYATQPIGLAPLSGISARLVILSVAQLAAVISLFVSREKQRSLNMSVTRL